MQRITAIAALTTIMLSGAAQAAGESSMLTRLDREQARYAELALTIWDKAELGYMENDSSTLLQDTLAREGFTVETGVAGLPTAFVASYGSGKPVIGLLAEPPLCGKRQPTNTAATPAATTCLVRVR